MRQTVTTPTLPSKATLYWVGLRPTTILHKLKERTATTPLSSQSWKFVVFRLLNIPLYLFHRIGIAIGPRTWFGDWYLKNVSFSGTVLSNRLSGAFGYGIAITSAHNFTVRDNILDGATSFIGFPGPQCADYNTVPMPIPFGVDRNNTENLLLQDSFVEISDGDSLTCILPPDGGDYWPIGNDNRDDAGGGLSKLSKVGIALGVFFGLCIIAIVSYRIRDAAVKRRQRGQGRIIKYIPNP